VPEELNDIHQAIGELKAGHRLTDARLNRFEASVWQVLSRLESKVDDMRTTLSTNTGGSRTARAILYGSIAIITAACTIAGMMSIHFAVSFK
jgi:hypothetical protein